MGWRRYSLALAFFLFLSLELLKQGLADDFAA
jgi:hypothetical protein